MCVKERNRIQRIAVVTVFVMIAFTSVLFAEQLEIKKTLDKLNQYDIDEVEHIFKEHPHLRDFLYGRMHAVHPIFTFRVGVGMDFGVFKAPWVYVATNRVTYPDTKNLGIFMNSVVDQKLENRGFRFVSDENYEPIEFRKWGASQLDTAISPMVFYAGLTTIGTWPKRLRGFQMVGSIGVWWIDGGDHGYTKGVLLDLDDPSIHNGWVITRRRSSLNSIGPYFGPGCGYVFSRLGVSRAELFVLWKGLMGFFPLFLENTVLNNEIFYTKKEELKNEDFQENISPIWIIQEEVKRDLKKSLGFLNEYSVGVRFLVDKDTYLEVKGGLVWTILQIQSTKVFSKRTVLLSPHSDGSRFSMDENNLDTTDKINQGISLFIGLSLQIHI